MRTRRRCPLWLPRSRNSRRPSAIASSWRELIGDFLDGLPAQLAALREASANGDAVELHRVAHTLKSNAATFGAEGLAQACGELEQAARGADPADTRELVARVEAEAARAEPALAAARDERTS